MRDGLADNVNARYVSRARERANGDSSRMQSSLHITQPIPSQHDTLWERFKSLIPSPEDLLVGTRQVTGFVVPHWAAGVLLAAILGAMGVMYSQMSSQHDMLIRLDQRLQDKNEHDKEKAEVLEKRLQNIDAVQIVLGRDLVKLQAKKGIQ